MEPQITITGNLGADVDHRSIGDNISIATFRLANTPRVYRGGSWVDRPTTWISVQCWRQLAENVADSLKKGDPVVVHGRLRTETWTKNEEQHQRVYIEATAVGHDLNRGVAKFKRNDKANSVTDDRDEIARQALAAAEGMPDEINTAEEENDEDAA